MPRRFTEEDKDMIIKAFYEGGILIPYEEIKAYLPIRKFVYEGLFFYYQITDPECFYAELLMPTMLCESAVKSWEKQRANIATMRGRNPTFAVLDEHAFDYSEIKTNHKPPKQRLKTKPYQRLIR